MAEKKTTTNNISLGITTKKRFTIDGDRMRTVELDTHDLALVNRLSESVKKMEALKGEWEKLDAIGAQAKEPEASEDEVDEAALKEISDFSEQFTLVENKMREIVDYIFDCPGLCQTALGNASIFSPVNGVYKFEQIIDVFTGLYEDTIEAEAKKINKKKVEERTSKYMRHK